MHSVRKVVGAALATAAGVIGIAFLSTPSAAADSPWDTPGPAPAEKTLAGDDSPWD